MISIIGFVLIILCIVYLIVCSVFSRFKCKIIYFTTAILLLISFVLICNSKIRCKLEYFGYFLVLGVIVFTLYYSFSNRITFKKGAITSLIILFISLIFIFDEITVEGVGLLKKAKSDANAIEELRKKLESDAKKVSELKEYLDSMLILNSSGQIDFKKALNVGNTYLGLNPGVGNLIYWTVDATSPDGTEHGFVIQGHGSNILKITNESDGAGGTKNIKVGCLGNLDIINPDNGVIMTSSNGSKWLLQMKNSGQLGITKF